MSTRHILIVNGDIAARTALGREIARLDHTVSYAAGGEDAARALSRSTRPDLALIETDLPDCDGQDLVARLRRRGALLPLILLADAANEDDVVCGLDAGADDFLVRPLRMREVAARIRAQFRATVGHEEDDLKVGILTFRPAMRVAVHPFLAAPVRLTEKEAALLARLCRAEGRAVSRQTLLREVWGYSPNASSHTVETHIYRLRRKIEGTGTPPIVLNDDGGYRLATEAEQMAPAESDGWNAPMPPAPELVFSLADA
jgi:DNA-binding response OmpR family regulator